MNKHENPCITQNVCADQIISASVGSPTSRASPCDFASHMVQGYDPGFLPMAFLVGVVYRLASQAYNMSMRRYIHCLSVDFAGFLALVSACLLSLRACGVFLESRLIHTERRR